MTIPALTTANTFSEWMNDTQLLISLMNSLTNGAQFNANTLLVVTALQVANLVLSGSSISGLNTASVVEAATNLYFTAARVRANVSNTAPVTYDAANGKFGLAANTSFIPEDANTNIYFTAARVRANVSNSFPIAYDAVNGRFSHGVSGVAGGVYGNGSFVNVITVDANGHINNVGNTPVLSKVLRNAVLQSTRAGLNFQPGANIVISVVDDAPNNQANITIDGVWGGGSNPLGFTNFKVNAASFTQNVNTVDFFAGSGLNIVGIYAPAGSGEAQVYFYANTIYNLANTNAIIAASAFNAANAAQLTANTNTAPTFIRAYLSNVSPILYDSANGILSHNVSPATATTYGNTQFIPQFTLGIHGHISAASNVAIDYSPSRTQVSNTAPINYSSVSGVISHAASGAVATTYGNTKFVAAMTISPEGHVSSASNVAIDYTGARAILANTAPINYDSTTGTYSHAASGVASGSYGDSITVPALIVTAAGHVSSVTNTAIRGGTTAQTGVVQLNDTVVSVSTTLASTANAVATVNNSITALSASLGNMSKQANNNVDIRGGSIINTSVVATRVSEALNILSPGSGAGVNIDWNNGSTSLTNSGTNALTFINLPVAFNTTGHLLAVTNLNSTTFPGVVTWGLSGKPSIAGAALVNLITFDGGNTVYASVTWRAV